jgi:hypothetical protein
MYTLAMVRNVSEKFKELAIIPQRAEQSGFLGAFLQKKIRLEMGEFKKQGIDGLPSCFIYSVRLLSRHLETSSGSGFILTPPECLWVAGEPKASHVYTSP